MDPNIQGVRKIDSSFGLQASAQIVQHKIGKIDSTCKNSVGSLNGGKSLGWVLRICSRKHTGEIDAAQRDIFSFQRSLPLHGAHQILTPHAVRGKREIRRRRSIETIFQKWHYLRELPEIHAIAELLTFVRRIRQELRVKQAGNFSAKKISLSHANAHGTSHKFGVAIEFFYLQRRYINRRDAKSAVRGNLADNGIGHRSDGRNRIRSRDPRQKTGARARTEPAI